MMKFKIGETIIEPTNGICTMEGMRKLTVDGIEMTVYIFGAPNATIYVPSDQVEKRNIRRPMDREEVKRVLASLKQPVNPNRDDARLQYSNYRETMKSGIPMEIARLLRNLFILDQNDDLKGKEKEIMDQAKKFICDEIAYIRQVSKSQVMEQINENLRQMYKKKQARDKEKAKSSGVDVSMEILGYGNDEEELEAIIAEENKEAAERAAAEEKAEAEEKAAAEERAEAEAKAAAEEKAEAKAKAAAEKKAEAEEKAAAEAKEEDKAEE
jgi:RNA polymerase-interacting CarD/CdnL/TRCF family regulator